MIIIIDRPEGRWLVRLLGTRGEARPAGWSLHRTGMRAGHVRGFTIILYTEQLTSVCLSVRNLLQCRISATTLSALSSQAKSKPLLKKKRGTQTK